MLNRQTPVALVGILAALVIVIVATTRGEAVNGLQMSISQDENAAGPNREMHLKVEFRNVGQGKITIVTGGGCGRRSGDTEAITLNLVDSQGTPHRRMPFLGDGPPYAGGCAGELSIYSVPLNPGASISLPLDLGKYFDLSDSKIFDLRRLHAGTYSLQAELTGVPHAFAGPSGKTWEGTVTSNLLQIHFDAEFAVL